MSARTATWVNGKRTIHGSYEYDWGSDRFYVRLAQTDRITGEKKSMVLAGDRPEWGNWRLVRPSSEEASRE